jgi:hypothetical protein
MKKWAVVVMVVSLLLVSGPVLGQEVTDVPTVEFMTNTPEATETAVPTEAPTPIVTPAPDDNPAPADEGLTPKDFIFVAIILALLAAYVLLLHPLIVRLGNSVPAVVVQALLSGGEVLLKAGEDYARTTPTKADDEVIAELRREFEALREELRKVRQVLTEPTTGAGD